MPEQDDARSCDCPRCDGFAERIVIADNHENDVYHCIEPDCGYIFLATEDWSRIKH